MNSRSEYEGFLLNELAEVVGDFEEPQQRAYCALVTMASGGKDIYESLLSLYFVKLPIRRSWLISTTAKFWGMDFLIPHCDCSTDGVFCLVHEISDDAYVGLGRSMKEKESEEYLNTKAEIITLSEVMGL